VSWVSASRVELVDTNPSRAILAGRLGLGFALPEAATGDADLVVHASGDPAGLALGLRLAGQEATVIELSWYGDRPVSLPLGEAFHSRRLTIRSSQVGMVAPSRRARWNPARRLALALDLLADPVFDHLIDGEVSFAELPRAMPEIAGRPGALCRRVVYPG
jgi:threonine dehydrogenase-like Zn-dependent dehydrogenase